MALASLPAAFAAVGDWVAAVGLLGGTAQSPDHPAYSPAYRTLGPAAFTAEFRSGQALTPREAADWVDTVLSSRNA